MQVDVDGRGRRTSVMKSRARRSNCKYRRVPKKSFVTLWIGEQSERSVRNSVEGMSTYSPTSDKLPKQDLADDRVSTLIVPGSREIPNSLISGVGGR
jgi:hypothetical protein